MATRTSLYATRRWTANDYFNKLRSPVTTARTFNHHNDYGFTIGGPIFIPKVYNTDKKKTFFFWSEEWRKITTPGSQSMAVATRSTTERRRLQATSFRQDPMAGWMHHLRRSASNTTSDQSPSCYSSNSQGLSDQCLRQVRRPTAAETTTSLTRRRTTCTRTSCVWITTSTTRFTSTRAA